MRFSYTLQSQTGPSSDGANSELWQPENKCGLLSERFQYFLQFFWSVFFLDVFFSFTKKGWVSKFLKARKYFLICGEQKKKE